MSSYGEAPGQTSCVYCPRAMVGRVIGRQGETIKALQAYTGASIQIDQSREPSAVTISGEASAVVLAQAMIQDIVNGTFKGFAMLRQMVHASVPSEAGLHAAPLPVYVEGYGFVPPTQAQEARILEGQNGALTEADMLPQFFSPEQYPSSSSSNPGFGNLNSPTIGGAFPIPMPRTPDSYAHRRMVHPGLESTPEGMQYSQIQGSPDISDMLSSLRFNPPSSMQQRGVAGSTGRLTEPSTPNNDFWAVSQPQRHLSGTFPATYFGGAGASGGLSSGGSSSSGLVPGYHHQPYHSSVGQPIPSSTSMMASTQPNFEAKDTFPERWSFPGASVLRGNSGIAPALKLGRISADSILSPSIAGLTAGDKLPGSARTPSFKSDTQDVGHIGTPPRGSHFPAASVRSSAMNPSSLDTSPEEALSSSDPIAAPSPRTSSFVTRDFTKAFSVPSGSKVSSPMVSPKSAPQQTPHSTAPLQSTASPANWIRLTDPEGRSFWHEASTGRSQWTSPV